MTPPPEAAPTVEHRFEGPGTLDRALALVRFLRVHCPWDREQTARSLVPHLLEEAHEVVDAIHDGSPEELEGELGDLLLNLAFQIVVGEERGELDADGVYARLELKMIRRHPHLFGEGAPAGDAAGHARDWESMKATERPGGSSVLAGLARGLDPLTKAYRIQERAAAVGFDWDDASGPRAKVAEELGEVAAALQRGDPDAVEDEVGDLLFAAVNLARLAGVHPTDALARANRKFRERFERLEALAAERGVRMEEAGLEALDRLWDEVKAG